MFVFIFAYWYTKYYTFFLLFTNQNTILFSFCHLNNFYWCFLCSYMPDTSGTYSASPLASPQPISGRKIDVLPRPTSTLLFSELVNAY